MHDKQTLFKHACAVRLKAYAPYSNYLVGACIETEDGNLYDGCNVENASYGLSICAEANAIAAMIAAGNQKIKQVLVVVDKAQAASPCGACRQRLIEFATAETDIHLANLQGVTSSFKLNDLLPHAFMANNLA